METTDTPMSLEAAAEALLSPIEEPQEAEPENQETLDETDEAEAPESEDAPEVEGEETDDDTSDEDVDDEDDEPPAEASEQVDALHDVKVNGQERKATLQELKNDFAGRAALQERHEALRAQEAKAQEATQTLQQQTEYVLGLFQQSQQGAIATPPRAPDPEIAKQDPIAFMEAQAEYQRQVELYNQQQGQIQFLQEQQQQQAEQAQKAAIAEQEQRLIEENPELRDPKRAEEFKKDLVNAGRDYGFSQAQMRAIISDGASFSTLRDAMKWRALERNKAAAKTPREAPKAVTKPKAKSRNASKVKREAELKQKAMKSQSDEDWAALLLNTS